MLGAYNTYNINKKVGQLIVDLEQTYGGYNEDNGAVALEFVRLPEHADKLLMLRFQTEDGLTWDEPLGADNTFDITELVSTHYTVEMMPWFRDALSNYKAHCGTKRLVFDRILQGGSATYQVLVESSGLSLTDVNDLHLVAIEGAASVLSSEDGDGGTDPTPVPTPTEGYKLDYTGAQVNHGIGKALSPEVTQESLDTALAATLDTAAQDASSKDEVLRASKKVYISVDTEGIYVIQRYNHEYDMRVYFAFRGVNQLIEFENIYLVPVTPLGISTDLVGGEVFWENSSDNFSPYSVRTVADGGGDFDWIFTGGNHGTDGNAGGQPTARCDAFRVYVDGAAYETYAGYADRVEIVWTNLIKAMNTVKSDGSGRDVVRETYRLYFDGYEYRVMNRIEILELVNIYSYFGLAFTINHYALPTWKGDVFFKSAQNTLKKPWNVPADAGGKRCEATVCLRDGHVLEFGINTTKGLGLQEQNKDETAAMARNPGDGKIYFDLIKNSLDVPADTVYAFEGLYKFSFED